MSHESMDYCEPLFDNSLDGLMYSEQFVYGGNNEADPSTTEAGATGFDFRAHGADFDRFISAAMGNPQILHGAAGLNPDDFDDDDLSDEYEDIDEDDDEQLNGDDSSQGEPDE